MAKNRISGEQVNLSSPENRTSIPILFREIFEFKDWQLNGFFSKQAFFMVAKEYLKNDSSEFNQIFTAYLR